MNDNKSLVEALVGSKVYKDYEQAFTEATGLPMTLRPVESWQLPFRGRRGENPFCSMIAERSRACSSCLRFQQELTNAAAVTPQTIRCEAGLSDTAVPVRVGQQLIGYLLTGQVFRRRPTEEQFERTGRLLTEWGVTVDPGAMRRAYFGTRVISAREHEAVVGLLMVFAQHLSMIGNQVLVQQANAEPPLITRAKEFIREHQTEDLSLGQVARAVNTSTFYFCKVFKKYTGINFTDYLSRVRIEKAKDLLLNPNLRISEIAYEVGFQSLTHFNRVFKRVVGLAPTGYRAKLRAI